MYDVVLDYNSLLNDVMITNATYLGISVGIIIFIGGFIYLFNIKPFQEQLTNTASELNSLKQSNLLLVSQNEKLKEELNKGIQNSKLLFKRNIQSFENRFGELEGTLQSHSDLLNTDIETKNTKLDNLINETQTRLIELEWDTSWNMHYVWESLNVHLNAIDDLLAALEKAQLLKTKWRHEIVLNKLKNILNKNLETLTADEDWQGTKENILTKLSMVDDFKEIKKEIITLLE